MVIEMEQGFTNRVFAFRAFSQPCLPLPVDIRIQSWCSLFSIIAQSVSHQIKFFVEGIGQRQRRGQLYLLLFLLQVLFASLDSLVSTRHLVS